jgi:hypothetical protein
VAKGLGCPRSAAADWPSCVPLTVESGQKATAFLVEKGPEASAFRAETGPEVEPGHGGADRKELGASGMFPQPGQMFIAGCRPIGLARVVEHT